MGHPTGSSTLRHTQQVREELGGVSGTRPGDWHLVSKGRHAMQLVLAQLPPGEVVTQPLTCITAVAPLVAAGHRPRYADIDLSTLTLDPVAVGGLLGGGTRAVVGQHSFGAAAPLDRVRAVLPEGTLLLEDACHCLGELARDASGTPVADVSVHSFGVEKMLPTRLGAAVWVNPEGAGQAWHARVVSALRSLPGPGVRGRVSGLVSGPAGKLSRRGGGPARRVVDAASRMGLVDQAIMPAELRGQVAGRARALEGRALAAVARELPGLERSRRHRRRIAELYREGLSGVVGVTRPADLDLAERTLVRYPLLLPTPVQAQTCFEAVQAAGLVPGRWYRPLLFPGPADPRPFAYDPATCPVAEDASGRILNLPTAPFVTPETARRAVEIVRAHVR